MSVIQGYCSPSPYPDTASQSMYEMQRRHMEREMSRRVIPYVYTLTEQDESMLRAMLNQMPLREVREDIERSQRYCLETSDQRGLARMSVLMRRLAELEYAHIPNWSTSGLEKIKNTDNPDDREFDINWFLKKVNLIKLKQEE